MHRILADQCVNRDIVVALRLLPEIEIVHTSEVSLATVPDSEIFKYAREHGFVLLRKKRGKKRKKRGQKKRGQKRGQTETGHRNGDTQKRGQAQLSCEKCGVVSFW